MNKNYLNGQLDCRLCSKVASYMGLASENASSKMKITTSSKPPGS